ncbi:MAG TPA: class I SAM-dependent methyltransferase [Burkholderiales bacterium]|nr:class I SAM-dependent methyltransferase [Burkholderiales bacterium]
MTYPAESGVHAPHAPLTQYYPDESQRRGWVRRMFDDTAADYDRVERFVGFGSGSWYRGMALKRAGLQAGMRVLDVGVGTGLVTRQIVPIVGAAELVTGVDPSPGMLGNARVPAGVRLVRGGAETLPFASDSFDFVTMGFALRHIADLSIAFRECCRVLRPGGRFCILEITQPESKMQAALLKGYLRGLVPWLARLTSRNTQTPVVWNYYYDTIAACAPPHEVLDTLRAAGFGAADRHVEKAIFSEYRADKPAR